MAWTKKASFANKMCFHRMLETIKLLGIKIFKKDHTQISSLFLQPHRWYKFKKKKIQGFSFPLKKTHTHTHTKHILLINYWINVSISFIFDENVHWLTDQLLSFLLMLTFIHHPDAARSWLQISVYAWKVYFAPYLNIDVWCWGKVDAVFYWMRWYIDP